MPVLGLDPGSSLTGWGLVEKQKDQSSGAFRAVSFGKIEVDGTTNPSQGLLCLHERLRRLLDQLKPDAVSVEELFFATNARTAIRVSQARGVILLAAAQADLPVFEYTPLQVKLALTGYGKAPKPQVGRMVQALLQLPEIPKPDDVADALAVAICHLNQARIPAAPANR